MDKRTFAIHGQFGALRAARGLSVHDVYNAFVVSMPAVPFSRLARYDMGYDRPGWDEVVALAAILGVSPERLAGLPEVGGDVRSFNIHKELDLIRRERGLSVQGVYEAVAVYMPAISVGRVGRCVQGYVHPRWDEVVAFASALGVSPERLAGLSDDLPVAVSSSVPTVDPQADAPPPLPLPSEVVDDPVVSSTPSPQQSFNIHKELDVIRRERGLSVQSVYEAVSAKIPTIPLSRVSRWAQGYSHPSWDNVVILANALGVSPERLAGLPESTDRSITPQDSEPVSIAPPGDSTDGNEDPIVLPRVKQRRGRVSSRSTEQIANFAASRTRHPELVTWNRAKLQEFHDLQVRMCEIILSLAYPLRSYAKSEIAEIKAVHSRRDEVADGAEEDERKDRGREGRRPNLPPLDVLATFAQWSDDIDSARGTSAFKKKVESLTKCLMEKAGFMSLYAISQHVTKRPDVLHVTAQELVDFVGELTGIVENANTLRHEIAQRNRTLIYSVIRKLTISSLMDIDSAAEHGYDGLIESIDRYDNTTGHRLSTVACGWIRVRVLRASNEVGRTIRIPEHLVVFLIKARAYKHANPDATEAEIADAVFGKVSDFKKAQVRLQLDSVLPRIRAVKGDAIADAISKANSAARNPKNQEELTGVIEAAIILAAEDAIYATIDDEIQSVTQQSVRGLRKLLSLPTAFSPDQMNSEENELEGRGGFAEVAGADPSTSPTTFISALCRAEIKTVIDDVMLEMTSIEQLILKLFYKFPDARDSADTMVHRLMQMSRANAARAISMASSNKPLPNLKIVSYEQPTIPHY